MRGGGRESRPHSCERSRVCRGDEGWLLVWELCGRTVSAKGRAGSSVPAR